MFKLFNRTTKTEKEQEKLDKITQRLLQQNQKIIENYYKKTIDRK